MTPQEQNLLDYTADRSTALSKNIRILGFKDMNHKTEEEIAQLRTTVAIDNAYLQGKIDAYLDVNNHIHKSQKNK